jgi:hypothetical protein
MFGVVIARVSGLMAELYVSSGFLMTQHATDGEKPKQGD